MGSRDIESYSASKAMIELGIIGMSKGNGHPYSWSAICNGYSRDHMASCPFPVIPEYLEKQAWPAAQIQGARVTHLWTQDKTLSREIAAASLIPVIVDNPEDFIGKVDGVLLARDDSENHERLAKPFLQAGLPIFIDKPLATSISAAESLLGCQTFSNQIFSCSALRFSNAFIPDSMDLDEVKTVYAKIPKYWETYGVHLIEPIVANFARRGRLIEVRKNALRGPGRSVTACWQNLLATFETSESQLGYFEVAFSDGIKVELKKEIDSFVAFKRAIELFLIGMTTNQIMIPREETLEIIHIIQSGCE